jgi:CubicO group peptidase (beta-lactamase class C family)
MIKEEKSIIRHSSCIELWSEPNQSIMADIRAHSLQDWMQSYVESDNFPGMMNGIYDEHRNELFHHFTSKGNKFQRDSIFRLYSMTKPITAVSLLILMERGLVSLEDEVAKFIPAFQQTQVLTGGTVDDYTTEPQKTPLKIIHLLTHTSGITYGFFGNTLGDLLLKKTVGDDWKNWFRHTDLETFCNMIAASDLSFQPGTKFHYSLSIDVVGRVIEVISGMKLDEFFQKEVFEPLQMHDTAFYVPAKDLSRLVECYEMLPCHSCRLSNVPERERAELPINLAGGGGLVSTLDDYSRFTCMLLNHGMIDSSNNNHHPSSGRRLLKEETVKLMYQNHLPNNANLLDYSYDRGFSEVMGAGYGFGLTMSVIIDPKKVRGGSQCSLGEYGWGGAAGTSFIIDPVKKFSAIFMTQLMGAAAVYPIRAQARWLTQAYFDTLQRDKEKKHNMNEK